MKDKRMSLPEAVRCYVLDGCSLTISSVGAREPVGVSLEIIRQHKRNLTFITDSSTEAAELLIAAGCIPKTESAYIWLNMGGGGG